MYCEGLIAKSIKKLPMAIQKKNYQTRKDPLLYQVEMQ